MKERPILFSAPMVRAILDGSKNQTRRIVKRQPSSPCWVPFNTPLNQWNWVLKGTGMGAGDPFNCPYGVPGDQLWVRETFYCDYSPSPKTRAEIAKVMEGVTNNEESDSLYMYYRADGEPAWEEGGNTPWKPSIHMPRWASRISLEITEVRVQRLQDISEEDARAEGVEKHLSGWMPYCKTLFELGSTGKPAQYCLTAKHSFQTLWERINGPGSWDANPWVWAISFKRVTG